MKLLWLVAAAGGAGLAAGLAPPGALFLGIDLSTQSCTAVVVDGRLDVVHRHSVNFDERFPEYGTESGYHAGDEGTATSPVAMWLDGLDRVLDELPESLLQQVDAISFSGQQHGAERVRPETQAMSHAGTRASRSARSRGQRAALISAHSLLACATPTALSCAHGHALHAY